MIFQPIPSSQRFFHFSLLFEIKKQFSPSLKMMVSDIFHSLIKQEMNDFSEIFRIQQYKRSRQKIPMMNEGIPNPIKHALKELGAKRGGNDEIMGSSGSHGSHTVHTILLWEKILRLSCLL